MTTATLSCLFLITRCRTSSPAGAWAWADRGATRPPAPRAAPPSAAPPRAAPLRAADWRNDRRPAASVDCMVSLRLLTVCPPARIRLRIGPCTPSPDAPAPVGRPPALSGLAQHRGQKPLGALVRRLVEQRLGSRLLDHHAPVH